MALEVCVDSVASAINACQGGARRLELCSSLSLGGLTPSVGLFKTIKKYIPPECKVFVMIRPKPGEDYIYDEQEVEVMAEDISVFKQNQADGFVFGCLNDSKGIDEKACQNLLERAKGIPCTFHRAFDVVKNPEESLRTIIKLGFDRILTSGQEKNAFLGRDLIKNMVEIVKESGSKLIVMPGGGVDESNLRHILETTGVKEFHGSARDKSNLSAANKDIYVTSESIVRKMIQIAKDIKHL